MTDFPRSLLEFSVVLPTRALVNRIGFTGNIGFHHVHHLDPRVPNYRLEECHRSHPAFARHDPDVALRRADELTILLVG